MLHSIYSIMSEWESKVFNSTLNKDIRSWLILFHRLLKIILICNLLRFNLLLQLVTL